MSRRNQAGDRFDEDEVVSRSITIDPQTGLENFVRPPLALIVRRAARWRCPNCGRGRLFARGFQMLQRCPHCSLSYFPESGYYLGAMIINYGVTATLVVLIFLFSLLFPGLTPWTMNTKILLWMAFAIALSLLMMRHSYSFWLALDFWITPRQPEPPTSFC
ncbi:MAG: hypothetical protein DMG29_00090 [Acidobacteria bacterium]|nr:MAG: hypothetical protein DMG29_00090 [Acidobacteriota bacterium]